MNNIKKIRISSNLTQKQLAEMLKINDSAISNWETGIANPTVNRLLELAKIFNCTIDELFSNEKN